MSLVADARSLYGSEGDPAEQRRWLVDGEVPVAVYGLGKMGQPLAAVLAETTGNVLGVDIDESVVERVARGETTVENEPGLEELLSETVANGALRATADPSAAAESASVHVVIVPTILADDETADLDALRETVHTIAGGLSAGDLVVIESTVPPGTCRHVVEPLLARESGLSVGEFGVAFCPERTASGRAIQDIRSSYPKVVGGVDAESTRTAELLYDEVTDNRVVTVSDATVAECVKLYEGVYRDVNIGLANELARLADEIGVDAREAIDVANTQPFCDIHDPGAGVGGHCIPYYPYFLTQGLEAESPVVDAARHVNESMPAFTAEKLLQGLDGAGIDPASATVAVLGVAYRPGVAETRASPAVPIVHRLSEAGVRVLTVDPVLDDLPEMPAERTTVDGLRSRDIDGAVLVTAHPEFDAIDWTAWTDLIVVDGRDALDLEGTDHAVYTIGRA